MFFKFLAGLGSELNPSPRIQRLNIKDKMIYLRVRKNLNIKLQKMLIIQILYTEMQETKQSLISYQCKSHCGVAVNVLDYNIVVSEFDLQLHYYVHFRTNTLEEMYKPFYSPPPQIWV